MNLHFSIYLDATRFLMAFLVFFYHSAFQNFLPWLPWVNVGHHAVIVFFVLSGMVIAWVAQDKENTCRTFLVARVSRIYSVFLPTLAITLITFYLGSALSPVVYTDVYIPASAGELIFTVMGNLFLINQHWSGHVANLGNVPLWSLCYEFWYYLIFAAFTFAGSRATGVALSVILLLCVGPRIALLFPLWILGVILYRYGLRYALSERIGWVLYIFPVLLYLTSYFLSWPQAIHEISLAAIGPRLRELGFSQHFAFDFLLGLGVAAHFMGANRIAFRFGRFLEHWERPIRYLASFTFTFYLLHYALLSFFAALLGHDPQSIPRGLLLWSLTLASIFFVGRITEKWRYSLRRILAGWFPSTSRHGMGA